MVGNAGTCVVHVNAPSVCLDAVGIDVGGHGPTVQNFAHDVFVALDTSVFGNGDGGILASGHGGADTGSRSAVHAGIDGRAAHVLGLVLLAGDVRHASVLVHPGKRGRTVSSVARTSSTAVDKRLNRGNHVALLTTSGDLNAITNGAKSGMSPASIYIYNSFFAFRKRVGVRRKTCKS